MQDRFKFRAWNFLDDEMLFDAVPCVGGGSGCTVPGFFDYSEREAALMQCTGLKDKNGEFIFEGDIVKDFNNAIIGKKFYLVKWNDLFSGFEPFCLPWGHDGTPMDTIGKFGVEIMGNIYENPELLNT